MKMNVYVTHVGEGMHSTSISSVDIESVKIKRDNTDGKNLITVMVNDKLIFSFDSNLEGRYFIENNIQKPMDKPKRPNPKPSREGY